MYIKEELAAGAEILTTFSNKTTEMLAVHVNKLNLILINIFRPPNTTMEDFRDILRNIKTILNNTPLQTTDLLLMGDFNFPHVNWETMDVSGGTADERWQAEEFLSLVHHNCLFPALHLILETTRGSNILDQILSNNPGIMHSYDILDTAMSDPRLIRRRTSLNP